MPTDLDVNGHMTNARYWRYFDLGRIDLLLRSPLARTVWKRRLAPMIGAGVVQFQRELRPFQVFMLETQLIGWSGTRMVIEQRVIVGDMARPASQSLVLAGFHDRRERRYVSADQLLSAAGVDRSASPSLPLAAQALVDMDMALRRDSAAPSQSGVPSS